jgi:hypothetical protein
MHIMQINMSPKSILTPQRILSFHCGFIVASPFPDGFSQKKFNISGCTDTESHFPQVFESMLVTIKNISHIHRGMKAFPDSTCGSDSEKCFSCLAICCSVWNAVAVSIKTGTCLFKRIKNRYL